MNTTDLMNMTLTNITELAKNTTIIIVATQPPNDDYLDRKYGSDMADLIVVMACLSPFILAILYGLGCGCYDFYLPTLIERIRKCFERRPLLPVVVVDDIQPQPQTEIEISYCGGNDYTLK